MVRAVLYVWICVFCVSWVTAQVEFGCKKDYCSLLLKPCPDLNCYDGRLIRNATICGCCHACVKSIEPDELCRTLQVSSLPLKECKVGTVCREVCTVPDECKEKCVTVEKDCIGNLTRFNEEMKGKELSRGIPKPSCDELGFYKPVQCKEGMLCYCANKNGKRIFGTAPYTEEKNMDCNCSRTLDELKDYNIYDEDEAEFLRCTSNGDYDGPQCAKDECYCIDKNGLQTSQSIPNNNGTIKTLSCYSSRRHEETFATKCLRAREKFIKQMTNATEYSFIILGLDRPRCDPDGSYSPKQCQGKYCYCVNKLGHKYYTGTPPKQIYIHERYSVESEEMLCNCLREKELLKTILDNKVTDVFATYECDVNGNYKKMQCSSAMCHCVDKHGFQKDSTAVPIVNRKLLKCH